MKPFYVFKGKYKDGRKRVVVMYDDGKKRNKALPKPEVMLKELGKWMIGNIKLKHLFQNKV